MRLSYLAILKFLSEKLSNLVIQKYVTSLTQFKFFYGPSFLREKKSSVIYDLQLLFMHYFPLDCFTFP